MTTSSTTLADTRRAEQLAALEREMGILVRRVRRVIHERAREVHPDLHPASYLMLAFVNSNGPQRSSAMAELFGVDKGAISRQVASLEELGLVERSPDPTDGRATLVAVTEEGERRLRDIGSQRRRQLEDRLAEWSEEDLARFAADLARYNEALNG